MSSVLFRISLLVSLVGLSFLGIVVSYMDVDLNSFDSIDEKTIDAKVLGDIISIKYYDSLTKIKLKQDSTINVIVFENLSYYNLSIGDTIETTGEVNVEDDTKTINADILKKINKN